MAEIIITTMNAVKATAEEIDMADANLAAKLAAGKKKVYATDRKLALWC